MCEIQIEGVFGVDIQSDGQPSSVMVAGVAIDCPVSESHALPGGPPRALITVATTDLNNVVIAESVFLEEEGTVDFFAVLKDGDFRCDLPLRISGWCGTPEDSECGVIDESHTVVCAPDCPPMTFETNVGDCEAGSRIVSVTASWSSDQLYGNTLVYWGQNQGPLGVGYGGTTAIEFDVPFGPADLDTPTVVVDLFPGCAQSVVIQGLTGCCPGPVTLTVSDQVQEPVDLIGLAPGSYTAEVTPGIYSAAVTSVEGVDAALAVALKTWTKKEGSAPAQVMPGTGQTSSNAVSVVLSDADVELAVVVTSEGCPDQTASVLLTPAVVPCPEAINLEVKPAGDPTGPPVSTAECLEPGLYRITRIGDTAGGTAAWNVISDGDPVLSAIDSPYIDLAVEQEALYVSVTVSRSDCPRKPFAGVVLEPCLDQPDPDPDDPDPMDPDETDPEVPDPDIGQGVAQEDQSGWGFWWCVLGLAVMLVFMVLGAIAFVVGLCLAPTGWWGWLLFAAGIVFLVIGLILYIVWVILCTVRSRNCLLMSILLTILGLLTAIAFVVSFVLSFIAKYCAIAGWIDVAYFGILYTVAIFISNFVGCGGHHWPSSPAHDEVDA